MAADPTGKFLYVAQDLDNNISGHLINATTGALTAIAGSPFVAGNLPRSLVLDPSARFAYVANNNGNDVSGYTISTTSGKLTPITGSPFPAGIGPRGIALSWQIR